MKKKGSKLIKEGIVLDSWFFKISKKLWYKITFQKDGSLFIEPSKEEEK